MFEKPNLEVDLNVSAEIAKAASALVANFRRSENLSDIAAHLCGALAIVLIALSKPGRSQECLPGLTEALKVIIQRVEALEVK